MVCACVDYNHDVADLADHETYSLFTQNIMPLYVLYCYNYNVEGDGIMEEAERLYLDDQSTTTRETQSK